MWVILGHSELLPKKSGQWVLGLELGTLSWYVRPLATRPPPPQEWHHDYQICWRNTGEWFSTISLNQVKSFFQESSWSSALTAFYNRAFSINNRLKSNYTEEGINFINCWDKFYNKPFLFKSGGLHLNPVEAARFGRLLLTSGEIKTCSFIQPWWHKKHHTEKAIYEISWIIAC